MKFQITVLGVIAIIAAATHNHLECSNPRTLSTHAHARAMSVPSNSIAYKVNESKNSGSGVATPKKDSGSQSPIAHGLPTQPDATIEQHIQPAQQAPEQSATSAALSIPEFSSTTAKAGDVAVKMVNEEEVDAALKRKTLFSRSNSQSVMILKPALVDMVNKRAKDNRLRRKHSVTGTNNESTTPATIAALKPAIQQKILPTPGLRHRQLSQLDPAAIAAANAMATQQQACAPGIVITQNVIVGAGATNVPNTGTQQHITINNFTHASTAHPKDCCVIL